MIVSVSFVGKERISGFTDHTGLLRSTTEKAIILSLSLIFLFTAIVRQNLDCDSALASLYHAYANSSMLDVLSFFPYLSTVCTMCTYIMSYRNAQTTVYRIRNDTKHSRRFLFSHNSQQNPGDSAAKRCRLFLNRPCW